MTGISRIAVVAGLVSSQKARLYDYLNAYLYKNLISLKTFYTEKKKIVERMLAGVSKNIQYSCTH
ncbi:hypothetical protein BpHYR1_032093 [Brachionus plicatilis]|uniref:Uncharacterized protein n=1 Tax=Brachionus plicatilis TaxID=10195 RepID=A0A3M7T0G0_BRAPC|nr:hypothetical protein BpHYR1_032093 [Brachionus plicatilis]